MNKSVSKIYFFVKYIIPVLTVAGIIFYLSAKPGLGSWMSNPLETILRKGAHFTEYGLLAFFLWRLFYNGWKMFFGASFWFALILSTLFAISDELHQSFVEGRNGSNVDVIVDFFSAFVILRVIAFFIKRKMKNFVLILVGVVGFSGIVGWMTWQAYRDINSGDNAKESQGINRIDEVNEGVAVAQPKAGQPKQLKSQNVVPSNDLVTLVNNSEGVNDDDRGTEDVNIIELPKKIENKVPFLVQSPFAKWDELHEEACEEASLIMLKYYNDSLINGVDSPANEGKFALNKKIIGKDSFVILKERAEDEIQKLVKYQIKKYGDFHDTDAKTTKEIGEEYFKLDNLKVIKDFQAVDLKKELAQGNIILIPTAGREIKNPYFSGAGPLYHNLVITGYNDAKNTFITNDPGTRRGENYEYKQQLLYNAIHDFPGDKNKILEGKKRAVVLISDQ